MTGFKSILILLYLVFLFSVHSKSQNPVTKLPIDTIFCFIYNQQFEKAERELDILQKKSDNTDYIILMIDLNWWKSVKKINVHDFTNFKVVLHQITEKLKVVKAKNELNHLILLSYSMRMAAHEDRYISMIGSFNKINRIIEILDSQPLTQHEKEIYELYKAILGIFKSKVFFYNSPGLRKESIATLENNSKSTQIIQKTIANYFLAKVYLELEDNPSKSIAYFKRLNQMYPHNSIFTDYIKLCNEKI
jgi:hypothetical protein